MQNLSPATLQVRDLTGWAPGDRGKAVMSFSELRSQEHVLCAQDQPRDHLVTPKAAHSDALGQSHRLRAGDHHPPVPPTTRATRPPNKG